MKPLSGLDALFLHLETPATPMHVGAVHLLQLPKRHRGDYVDEVRRHVSARLSLSPVFTRQIAELPLNIANPVWVRARSVDLERHIVRLRLPRPGTQAQLEALVARLHARCMPRDRPLWAFHVIEGLRSGQPAFYTKIHHATLDGAAGVALARALLDTSARPRRIPSLPPVAAERPDLAALLGSALRANRRQLGRVVRQLPMLAAGLGRLAAGAGTGFGRNLAFGPRTVINGQIGSARSFATASLPIARVKRVAQTHGATVNEVVLATVAGALRRYLASHGGVPLKPLVAAVPVSLREAGNEEATTLATMTLIALATHIDDPVERLREVRAASGAAKGVLRQLRSALPTDFPSLGLPWLLSLAATLYGRWNIADRLPPLANVVVSNVPGPDRPLYLAGARLMTYWPVSIVEHGVGLNITLQGYVDSLDFGLLAARSAVPDARRLAQALLAAFDELESASFASLTSAARH